jgi:hypothetical protein
MCPLLETSTCIEKQYFVWKFKYYFVNILLLFDKYFYIYCCIVLSCLERKKRFTSKTKYAFKWFYFFCVSVQMCSMTQWPWGVHQAINAKSRCIFIRSMCQMKMIREQFQKMALHIDVWIGRPVFDSQTA